MQTTPSSSTLSPLVGAWNVWEHMAGYLSLPDLVHIGGAGPSTWEVAAPLLEQRAIQDNFNCCLFDRRVLPTWKGSTNCSKAHRTTDVCEGKREMIKNALIYMLTALREIPVRIPLYLEFNGCMAKVRRVAENLWSLEERGVTSPWATQHNIETWRVAASLFTQIVQPQLMYPGGGFTLFYGLQVTSPHYSNIHVQQITNSTIPQMQGMGFHVVDELIPVILPERPKLGHTVESDGNPVVTVRGVTISFGGVASQYRPPNRLLAALISCLRHDLIASCWLTGIEPLGGGG